MMRPFLKYAALWLGAAGTALAANLVPDASFEAGSRPWLEARGGHLLREKAAGAPEGEFILSLSGWGERGGMALSPKLALAGGPYHASVRARLVGDAPEVPVTLELLLLDAEGKEPLAVLASGSAGPEWATLEGGAALPSGEGRLGLRVSGGQPGVRVELDCLGLFAGEKGEAVVDNAEAWVLDAVKLGTEGGGWSLIPSDGGTMYFDPAFNAEVLSGAKALEKGATGEASHAFTVRRGGSYRLWTRYLRTRNLPGAFTVEVRQGGKVVASRELESTISEKDGEAWQWMWAPLEATLEPGPAELILRRPPQAASSTCRRVDRFYLTNVGDYTPRDADFRTPVYFRFTNRSEGVEPFCFWLHIRRHIGPHWYANPGILSHAGLSGGYAVPSERQLWLAPGESSPWVSLGDYLLPVGGRNNVQMIATRKMHTSGFVEERLRGTLEFARGPERHVFRTVEVDQQAPRILFTLPAELEQGELRFGADYQAEAAKALPPTATAPKGNLKNLEVGGHLTLRKELDDPALVHHELELMRRLGMDNTYTPAAPASEAVEWNRALGLPTVFGYTHLASLSTLDREGEAKLDAVVAERVEQNGPILDRIHRLMLVDEPMATTLEKQAAEPIWKERFREWLQARGVTLETLGVTSWEEVAPATPAQKEKQPALYYYSGLFRLHSLAERLGKVHEIYRRHFPPTALTTVNLSPSVFSGISDEQGHDEYLLYGKGGLDLVWTEDWPGYGGSPQQMSAYLAMLRVAGAGKPLGGFQIPVVDPAIQRIKMYLWLAAGVKMLNLYCYGPYYASIDSWSTRYGAYPTIAEVGAEIRRLDPYLVGMERRPARIAIVYNRTAGIWRGAAFATEQDARYTHWALAHAGYDADFISEDEVEAGKLERYGLIYLNGVQLRREAAEKLAAWVAEGGTLVATAGAGTRDPFNQPLATLEPVFGARSTRLHEVGNAGRPLYETRKLQSLGEVRTTAGLEMPSVAFPLLALRERLELLPGAQMALEHEGNPVGVLHAHGKGRTLRLAGLPGLAYFHEAMRQAPEGRQSLPQGFRRELRDFIAWPARWAGVEPVVEAEAPLVEVARWDHPDRTLLYVVDYGGTPQPGFSLRLPDAGGFVAAHTVRGQPVRLKAGEGGRLEVAFPLDVADVVILERAPLETKPEKE